MGLSDATIAAALDLRGPALALLAGSVPDDEDAAVLARASADAWRLMLAAECCAAPLAAAMRRSDTLRALPPDAADVLRAAEGRELQRVLAARAQLGRIDAVAARLGLHVVVLKGGAVVADGTAVDLGDLDLSLPHDRLTELGEALVRDGYAWDDAGAVERQWRRAGRRATRHRSFGDHLPSLLLRGGIPVELHAAPRAEPPEPPEPGAPERAKRPLPGAGALRREVGEGPLYGLLDHAVVQHPFRRGHLRDLVVIAEMIRRCRPDEVARVRARCLATPHGPELVAMLEQAEGLAASRQVADAPHTRRIAARKYALSAGRERWMRRPVPRWPGRLAYTPLERPALRRLELAALVRDAERDHPLLRADPLARRAPRVATTIAGVAARGYRLAVAGLVMAAGPLVRWRVDRAVRASRRGTPTPPAAALARGADRA